MSLTTILCDRGGERADAAIARLCPELSRSAAQRLLSEGRVMRGGKALKKSDTVAEGDSLTLELPEAVPVAIVAEDIPLDVPYRPGSSPGSRFPAGDRRRQR